MTNKIIIQEIENLAQICRKEETNLLIGRYELNLNHSIIQFIDSEYKLNSNNNNNNNIQIKVNYLRQLFCKIPSIKIIGEKFATDSIIRLNPFISCVCLQLIRISFKNLIGLEKIRPQLKSLKCFKCFETQVFDEEFWDLFGVWPQLTSLTLSQNNIISIKVSVIPSSVQILDLSWNRIKEFNNVSNFSVNNISKLDLSYNCLTKVPKLNTFSCSSLNSLFLRGNLIEDISGIEKLTKLIELDIGFNCIIDLVLTVSYLKKCKSLKILWINGNPFTCDPNANEIIIKELSFLSKLNETSILRDQRLISPKEEEEEETNNLIDSRIKPNSDEESDQFFDASCDSIDSKSENKSEMNRKKKLRVIEIKDRTEIEEQFDKLKISSNKSNDNILGKSSEAKELIQKRKELGDEWLVSLRPSSVDNSSQKILTQTIDSKPLTTNKANIDSIQRQQSVGKPNRKISTISMNTTDDEIEILTEEKSEWSRKELENDTNIVIVENSETNETFFVYVREEDGIIFEKDCITGKVLRTHDLKILTNVELINDLELKIGFDSLVYSKREVKYRFDSIESCLGFNDKFIIPWISQRKQQMVLIETLYECLKCGKNKMSSSQVIRCGNCGSDVIMKCDVNRKRRSGSDITILSQMNPQNQSEMKFNFEEINLWEELFSINTCYDNSFFTRVEHSLKLYIEVKLLEAEEEIQGLVKCKAMIPNNSRLESALLIVSNKNILIISVNENENYDRLDSYLKLKVSKSILSLTQIKMFPNLLIDQGFWLQFKDEQKKAESKSRTRSFINILSSKRSSISDMNSLNILILFYDQNIGKSFLNYFNETINKITKIPINQNKSQTIQLTENSMTLNDDIIVINTIKSAEYQRNDMKSELKLFENIAVIVTEQLVILGEILFDFNGFYNIKVLYKDFIMNLMPQIFINLNKNCLKLSFSDDNIETNFTINSFTTDSIKRILIPIKSQWEKDFDVSLPLYKL